MAEMNEPGGPGAGTANLGSLAGAVIGSVGGLFSVGIPPAIVFHNLQEMFATPKIAVICFLVSGTLGWLIGGLLGPRLGKAFQSPWAEMIGGVLGGLIPVAMVLGWSYSMVS